MKKILTSLCLAAVLVMMTSTVQTGLAMAETFTLKAVTAWPKTASEYKAFTIFSELVEQEVAKKPPVN